MPSAMTPEEQPLQHQVLELLNLCMVRNPEVCFPIIIKEYKNVRNPLPHRSPQALRPLNPI